jgi:hypothetical protein
VTIEDNSFDRAERGSCVGGGTSCNHNDHIQILGGGPWTIVGNRFGDRNAGAASIWVQTAKNNDDSRIHDVTVQSNTFAGSAGLFAIEIGASAGGGAGVPQRVAITGNTVLSGTRSAIWVHPEWAALAPARRPVVTGNVLAVNDGVSCADASWSGNTIDAGPTCSASDVRGPAAGSDSTSRTTRADALVRTPRRPHHVR